MLIFIFDRVSHNKVSFIETFVKHMTWDDEKSLLLMIQDNHHRFVTVVNERKGQRAKKKTMKSKVDQCVECHDK